MCVFLWISVYESCVCIRVCFSYYFKRYILLDSRHVFLFVFAFVFLSGNHIYRLLHSRDFINKENVSSCRVRTCFAHFYVYVLMLLCIHLHCILSCECEYSWWICVNLRVFVCVKTCLCNTINTAYMRVC